MISAIVVTQNEERNIGRCLRSLSWVDEIIVVDALSTDRTVEIARECGAKVYSHAWLGFVAQKQFALDQARGDWVLSLDADEELEPDLIREIVQALENVPADVNGCSMPRKCYYFGKWIHHGEWYPDRKLRIMRRSKSVVGGQHVHETFDVEGKIQPLVNNILHYSFTGLIDHVLRMRRYGGLMALKRYETGHRFSIKEMMREPFARAYSNYVLLQGYRDGYRGVIITGMLYYYVFIQHIGILRLQWKHE